MHGADPNADGPGFTALHWAAGSWETETTGPLGIMAPPDHEWSAMGGVQIGKQKLVESLLDHGADPNVHMRDRPLRYGMTKPARNEKIRDSTPFMLAALAGEVDIMQMLVDRGADPLAKTEFGTTAIMLAAGVNSLTTEMVIPIEDSLAAIKLCEDLGADINEADTYWGHTPMHGAAQLRSVELIRYLVDQGADVNAMNFRGQTPLYLADRYWRQSGSETYDPTPAGDLLRTLTAPEMVSKTTIENNRFLMGDPVYPAGCRVHLSIGGTPSFARDVFVMAFDGKVDLSDADPEMLLERHEGKIGPKRYARRLGTSVLIKKPGTYTIAAVVMDDSISNPTDSLQVAYGTVSLNENQQEQFISFSFGSRGKSKGK
jgi:hypothetical protein